MNEYQLTENIYRIPVPVPFPMKYVYCYLIKSSTGWSLIDTGFNYEQARQFWLDTMKKLDIEPAEIKQIYLTHFHPDHFGLAGWMQELTKAPVYISRIDYDMINRLWAEGSKQIERIRVMSLSNGVPEELAEQICQRMQTLNSSVLPLPELKILDTKQVKLADKEWQVIHTPGHSDGHICFYNADERTIIIGDHVLEKITPNVSLWPGCSENPLAAYLKSLKKVKDMDIKIAYPAHNIVIEDISKRVEQILEHHDERIEKMYNFAKKGKTAYQVALDAFSHIQLNAHQWRFALAETLSHLEYLFYSKRLKKTMKDSIIYYSSDSIV